MKVKEQGLDYKRNLIYAFVAGAMALSWGTINHVNDFLHTHVRTIAPRTTTKSKTSDTPDYTPDELKTQEGPILSSAGPPVSMEGTILTHNTQATMAGMILPQAASQPQKKASFSNLKKIFKLKQTIKVAQPTSSLITAVAAKAGVNLVSITETKIDRGFIRKVEGSVLKGYVPLAATTNSGVTIADGFDLGQMRPAEFSKLPISSALKAKLQPYIGLTRFQAVSFLRSHPLAINENELDQLNVVAANKILQPLVKVYEKSTGQSFLNLPAQAQTVIFSYAYQHGPGFMHVGSGRQLWSLFVAQNWHGASASLRASRMYTNRRQMEASLLDHIA